MKARKIRVKRIIVNCNWRHAILNCTAYQDRFNILSGCLIEREVDYTWVLILILMLPFYQLQFGLKLLLHVYSSPQAFNRRRKIIHQRFGFTHHTHQTGALSWMPLYKVVLRRSETVRKGVRAALRA